MTTLERYQSRRAVCEVLADAGCLRQDELLELLELDYRIGILCTLQSFFQYIQKDTELPALIYHYQVITAFFDQLVKKRKFGYGMDEKKRQKKDEALRELEQTIKENKEDFLSANPQNAAEYKKNMGKHYGKVVSKWLIYREQYVRVYA